MNVCTSSGRASISSVRAAQKDPLSGALAGQVPFGVRGAPPAYVPAAAEAEKLE